MSYDSVLMIGFGGPTSPGHSTEFVRRVVGNRPGLEERIAEVARHYDELGGISPYNQRTLELAEALGGWLGARGVSLPVRIAMRFWDPLIPDELRSMAGSGCNRAIGIILSVHQCAASWDKYKDAVAEAMAVLPRGGFRVDYTEPFHAHPGFIEAVAGNLRGQGIADLGEDAFERAAIIFTAHSVPEPVAAGSPYVGQYAETAEAVSRRLGHRTYALAYQSAAGGRVPWLGPDVSDAIRAAAAAGARDVVVCPIGFLCDHVEVLYDLDRVARQTAGQCGVGFSRPRTVESHPRFIDALGERVLEKLRAAGTVT